MQTRTQQPNKKNIIQQKKQKNKQNISDGWSDKSNKKVRVQEPPCIYESTISKPTHWTYAAKRFIDWKNGSYLFFFLWYFKFSFHSIQVFFQGIQFTIDYNKLFMLEEVH